MPFKALKTSTLPVVRLTPSEPRVTIRATGQATISTRAAEVLEGCDFVIVLKDATKNLLGLKPVKEKPAEGLKINRPKSGKSVSIGLGGMLREYFPEYKFQEAGTQSFDAQQVNVKGGPILVVKIPTETPAYRAPAKRGPRKPKLPVAEVGVAQDDEPVLE